MNFMAIFDGIEYPIIIPFSKTSYKAGKKLFSLLAFGSGFSRKFRLKTIKKTNDQGTYYVYDVVPGDVTAPEEVAVAKKFLAQFAQRTAEIKPAEDNINWDK